MSTYIILLWSFGEYPDNPPTDILGPFTYDEAERVNLTLTCEREIRKISTTIPEWAAS